MCGISKEKYKHKFNNMTYTEDLNRIEIIHLREMLVNVKEENENLKLMNRTLEVKNELYLQQLESEYRKSKL